ncbi:MAG: hypothetical protein D6701_10270 [Gemmatimonadetes bacterium]|nr:MAG: hypothetical protein D6701_10270 [Gemmatimonadota bacterium]
MSGPVDSLRSFVARNGRGTAGEPIPGVVVFAAGKGGVGTSTLAALVGVAAARRGVRTLLVDAHETLGTLHHLLGVSDGLPGIGALDAAAGPADLRVRVTEHLDLLPGGARGPQEPSVLAPGERAALYRKLSSLYVDYDLVLIDGGARLDAVTALVAAGCERVLTVTAPDRVSLAGSYAMMKVVSARFPDTPVEVLVSGRGEPEARAVFQVVETAAGHFLGVPVAFAGGVPEDPAVRAAAAAGEPLHFLEPETPAWTAAGAVLDRLLFQQHSLVAGPSAQVLSLFD